MEKVTWILTYIMVVLATVCNANTLTASCTMEGVSAVDTEKITGTVEFSQLDASNIVTVVINLSGFSTTDSNINHGFHIHETGSTASNCGGAGSHFDGVTKGTNTHGGPTSSVRHVGDLGNIVETNGKVSTTLTDTTISLKSTSNNYIVNRAVVVHQDRDDLGVGSASDSTTTGNAGKRIGCCVITAGAPGVTFSVSLMALCLAILSVMKW